MFVDWAEDGKGEEGTVSIAAVAAVEGISLKAPAHTALVPRVASKISQTSRPHNLVSSTSSVSGPSHIHHQINNAVNMGKLSFIP